MAVQMMTGSSQDLLNIPVKTDNDPVKAGAEDALKFGDELASASKENETQSPDALAKDSTTRSMDTNAKTDTPTQRSSKTNAAAADRPSDGALDMAEDIVIQLPAEMEIGHPVTLLDTLDIKTVVSVMRGEEIASDGDIDDMIEQAVPQKRPTRFDPDSILGEFMADILRPAVSETEAPKDETKDEATHETDETPVLIPVPVLIASENVELSDPEKDAPVLDISSELVVGEDENGEIAVKAAAPEIADHRTDKKDDVSRAAMSAPELTDYTDAAETDRPADRRADSGKIELQKNDGSREELDAKIAQMLDKYRGEKKNTASRTEERTIQQDAVDGSNKRRGQTTAARRANEALTAHPRDTRHDATQVRETHFADTLASKLRDAAEAEPMPGVDEMPRAGGVYQLDRENAFGDGLGSVLEFMRTGDTHEARIVVEPPALGHIDVSIRASESGLQATFKVDNDHLKMMVQQHLDILKSSLETQGIHVSSIAVDLRSKDDQSGQGANGAKQGKKGRGVASIGGDDEQGEESITLARLDLEQGHLHWVG